MASFTVDTDSENILCDTNIQQFCSPKVSEKDFSIYFPNSSDNRMQKLSSPINGLFEHDNSIISIAESEIKNDAETTLDSSVVDVTPVTAEETPQERMEREERESQELAWQLMQQDNLDMYNMQLQFMQQNAGDMSEEDLRVMQELMNESNQQVLPTTSGTGEENEEDDEEEEGDELNESDSSNWDYERLLQLGQQLGDVKTERWRMRSKNVIDSLPRRLYKDIVLSQRSATSQRDTTTPSTVFQLPLPPASPICSDSLKEASSEKEVSSSNKKRCIRSESPCCPTTTALELPSERCVVCMDDYEAEEQLVVFPCQHYFHLACTEGWLADHNCCPSCTKKVVATPEK